MLNLIFKFGYSVWTGIHFGMDIPAQLCQKWTLHLTSVT